MLLGPTQHMTFALSLKKYGTVEDIEVAMYNKTKSRGLVFVTMGSHEEAKELEGRPLRLAWAKPKTKKPSSPPPSKPLPVHNLFVANLHFEAMSKDLLDLFHLTPTRKLTQHYPPLMERKSRSETLQGTSGILTLCFTPMSFIAK